MDAVSNIPELLEMILLELSIKDLLVNAQRVNKTFKLLIDGSPRLQQALFFQPVPGRPLHLISTTAHDVKWLEGPGDKHEHNIAVNPFWKQPQVHLTHASAGDFFRLTPGLDRPEASWRRMLVSQPPVIPRHEGTEFLPPRKRQHPHGAYQRPRKRQNPHGAYQSTYGKHKGGKPPVSHANVGLTMGAIDRHFTPYTRLGSPCDRVPWIVGMYLWRDVHFAWEVKHMSRPKPAMAP